MLWMGKYIKQKVNLFYVFKYLNNLKVNLFYFIFFNKLKLISNLYIYESPRQVNSGFNLFWFLRHLSLSSCTYVILKLLKYLSVIYILNYLIQKYKINLYFRLYNLKYSFFILDYIIQNIYFILF